MALLLQKCFSKTLLYETFSTKVMAMKVLTMKILDPESVPQRL